jgi:hypothetical protein
MPHFPAMRTFLATTRKAAGAAVAGLYVWWGAVLLSASGPVTPEEWYALGGVGVAVLAVYGITNAPSE